MYQIDRHVSDVFERQRAVRAWAEARRLAAGGTGSPRRSLRPLRLATRALRRALPGSNSQSA